MSNTTEVVADLQATIDYLSDIVERVDSMPFEDLVAVQDEARRVQAKAGELVGMIDGELVRQLEAGARELPDGRLLKRVKNYVERYDHDRLIALAARQGVEAWTHPETGEVDGERAAESAARALAQMYLSASTKAKVTVVERLGVNRREFLRREFKDWKVLVIEEDPDE